MENLKGYLCSSLLIFTVSFYSCSFHSRNICKYSEKNHSVILLGIEHEVDQDKIKNQMIDRTKKLSENCGKLSIIGIYNKKVRRSELKSNNSRAYRSLIYTGKYSWGGVIIDMGEKKSILNWLVEPMHEDIVFPMNKDLIKAGAWFLHDIKKYIVFLYSPNKRIVQNDFDADIKKYARIMIRAFDGVDILVFKDKVECRKFASENNRLSLLKMAAITPVNKYEFFKPNSTEHGFWFYRVSKDKTTIKDKWSYVK